MNLNNANRFDRNNPIYPRDNVKAIQATQDFKGYVTDSKIKKGPTQQTPTWVRLIDGAIQVKTVDDKTRQKAIEYFEKIQRNSSLEKQHHRNNLYKGLAVTLIGLGLTFGSIHFIPLPLYSIAGAAAGVTSSIFGIWKGINSGWKMKTVENEANVTEKMKSQWEDPALEAIEERRKAGQQGFQYAYKNCLKGKLLHEEEVQTLWLKDFYRLLNGQQNIHQLSEENLLGNDCIEFAWNHPQLPDIKVGERSLSASALNTLSSQFRMWRTNFMNFQATINHEFEALNNHKIQLKKEIDNLRQHWLYPSECLYTQSIQEIDSLYHEALRPFMQEREMAIENVKRSLKEPENQEEVAYKNILESKCNEEIQHIYRQYNNLPEVIEIERAYKSDRQRCGFLLSQSQLMVNAFFDTRFRQLEEAYCYSKTQIEEQQKMGYRQFHDSIHKILSHAEKPLPTFNYTIPATQRKWKLPQLAKEPSWHEVYGQTPYFQPGFKSEISELSWELFWSKQGFGRFQSCPTSSWDQLSQQRNLFPFKEKWFNLHHLSQRPRPGIFVREILVPPPPLRICVNPQANLNNERNRGHLRAPSFSKETNHPKRPTNVANGFGGTQRRGPENEPLKAPSKETNHPERPTRIATAFGGTERRGPENESLKAPSFSNKKNHPERPTSVANGFGGTERRGSQHVTPESATTRRR